MFIHICCISLLSRSTCSTGTTVSLEDRLEQLTINYVKRKSSSGKVTQPGSNILFYYIGKIQFEEKFQIMEGKVTQLEIQVEKHVSLFILLDHNSEASLVIN